MESLTREKLGCLESILKKSVNSSEMAWNKTVNSRRWSRSENKNDLYLSHAAKTAMAWKVSEKARDDGEKAQAVWEQNKEGMGRFQEEDRYCGKGFVVCIVAAMRNGQGSGKVRFEDILGQRRSYVQIARLVETQESTSGCRSALSDLAEGLPREGPPASSDGAVAPQTVEKVESVVIGRSPWDSWWN